MNYNVKSIPVFEKQAKRLIKKYPSLKNELFALVKELKQNPQQGKPLGKNCFKIRLAIAAKNKGKSGGARLITNFVVTDATVYLINIYDKGEKENISDKELDELLKFIPE
jgi:hypothetical protein